MVLAHVLIQRPHKRGNQFYRDKNDYARYSKTLCGADITGKDIPYFTAGTKSFRASGWPVCAECMARRTA